MNKNLQISLSIDDANLVLNALGALPHNQVRALIDHIAQEAQKQITAAQALNVPPVEVCPAEQEADPVV
ncbi:MAG: hypothetical protein WC829_01475 [Hyphomicrobium sp.]|jgi:hypothetical protein